MLCNGQKHLLMGLGLWCSTSFSTLFQLYRGGQFLLVEETGEHRENYRSVLPKKKLKQDNIHLIRLLLQDS
jgi:hypothetical protein